MRSTDLTRSALVVRSKGLTRSGSMVLLVSYDSFRLRGSLGLADSFTDFGALFSHDSFASCGALGVPDSFGRSGALASVDSFVVNGALGCYDSF